MPSDRVAIFHGAARGVLYALACGIGLGLTLGGLRLWNADYRSRHPMFTATFSHAEPTLDFSGMRFSYIVSNQSGRDYRIEDSKKDVHVMLRTKAGTVESVPEFLQLEEPLFLPEGEKTSLNILLKFEPSKDIQAEYKRIRQRKGSGSLGDKGESMVRGHFYEYLRKSKVTGFLVFDQRHQFKIDCPQGW